MERRQEILSTAMHLFSEKGFSRTPTSLIAREAGVAEGLIFHYFKNKTGILVNILNEIVKEYIEGLEAIDNPSLSGLEIIEQFIIFHFNQREKQSKAFMVLNRELVSDIIAPDSAEFKSLLDKWDSILNVVKHALLKGQADGSIRNVPIDETALVIRGLLMGVSNLYREVLNIPNIETVPREVVNFICRSLSSDTNFTIGDNK